MSNLAIDKVLRVNCPGWGVSSNLPLGEAKPLAMYDVIVINPTSIVHLFEPESETAGQIDKLLASGSWSLKLDDDTTLESISAELELREHELQQFLSKGGLLVYFLAPAFVVSCASLDLDNYVWLHEYAPDKLDSGAHTMSPGKGKNLNISVPGKEHIFAPYLAQSAIEWNTYVLSENLSDGYLSLADGGTGKCLAACKSSGPKQGQVVFLPAPYEARYDDVLKNCILNWHDLHTGAIALPPVRAIAANEESKPEIGGRALLDNLFSDDYEAGNEAETESTSALSAAATTNFDSVDSLFGTSSNSKPLSESDLFETYKSATAHPGRLISDNDSLEKFDKPLASSNLFDEPAAKIFDEAAPSGDNKKTRDLDWPELEADLQPFAKERQNEKGLQEEKEQAQEAVCDKETSSTPKVAEPVLKSELPEAKDLISKMGQNISSPSVPDWCKNMSFGELKQLQIELNELNQHVASAQKDK